MGPTRLVSYFTSIFPLAPGATGWFVQEGTVQPQDEATLVITSGALPVLVNSNTRTPSAPCLMLP